MSRKKQSKANHGESGQKHDKKTATQLNPKAESQNKVEGNYKGEKKASVPTVKDAVAPKKGFFARLIESIKSLFGGKKSQQLITEKSAADTELPATDTADTSVSGLPVANNEPAKQEKQPEETTASDELRREVELDSKDDSNGANSEEEKHEVNNPENESSDQETEPAAEDVASKSEQENKEKEEKSQTQFINLKENLEILGITALDDVKSWGDINDVTIDSLTKQIEKLKAPKEDTAKAMESKAKADAEAQFKAQLEELCKAVKTFFGEQDIKNANSIEVAKKYLKEYLKDIMKNKFKQELKDEELNSNSLYDLLQVFFDKVEVLVKEISAKKNEADQANVVKDGTISQKEKLIEQLQESLSTAKAENESLKATDAAKLTEELEALKAQHETLQQEKDSLEQNFNEQVKTITANNAKIDGLNDQVKKLTNSNEEQKKQIDTLEKDKTDIIVVKNRLAVAKENLEKEINADREKHENEIKQREQKINEQRTKINEQEGTITAKEVEIENLETEKGNLIKEKEDLNEVIQKMNGVIKDKEDKQKEEIANFMQQIRVKVKEIGDSISIPGYIIPCDDDVAEQAETLEGKVKGSFEAFRNNFDSFAKELDKNAKTIEELRSRLQKMMERELGEQHSWINQLAIYYAYSRIPFMTGSKRDYGMQLDRKAMVEIYRPISDMLGLLSMSQQLPLLFVEKVNEGSYEDVTGKEYNDLDNFCSNSRNHLDQVDTEDRSNIIVDIADVGYSKDGKIVKQTKIMH